MCNLCTHDVAEVPMEGNWISIDDISKINGVSHGVGGCPPQQGACKLTLNRFFLVYSPPKAFGTQAFRIWFLFLPRLHKLRHIANSDYSELAHCDGLFEPTEN